MLYVEWQNRGGGGEIYIAQYWLQNTLGGGAMQEALNAKTSID